MIGTTIAHYRILEKLGEGGMGTVYKAVDLELERTVALKFIPDEAIDQADGRERFLREARAASQLDHVNIGTIFAVEQTDEGRVFIAMAYYGGETLATVIRRGPLAPATARAHCIQLARGLAHAHSRGIVHRDVKPANVLMTRGGVLKLVDFGLAQVADISRITRTGHRLGTPGYMSPEQALGLAVDHRSDIWALGVVLYEMLTGTVPFKADSVPATLYQIVHGSLPSLEAVTPDLRAVLGRALDRDPARRYESMSEMLADLGDGMPLAAHVDLADSRAATLARLAPPHASRHALSWWRERRWPRLAAAGAAVGLVLLFVAGGPWSMRRYSSRGVGSTESAHGDTAPMAYKKYLEGKALLERWDKGDNLALAVAAFEEAVRLDPGFALAFAGLSEGHLIQSTYTDGNDSILWQHDQALADQALREATRAAQLNPESAQVQVALAGAHASKGHLDLALVSLQRALKLDIHNADVLVATGQVYEKLGRRQEAEASLTRAADARPDYWQAQYALGSLYYGRRAYAKAIQHWTKALEITPDNARVCTHLGQALMDSGHLADAQTMYERALATKPNFTAYTNLGSLLYRVGRYPEAAQVYEKALELSTGDYMSDQLAWGNLAATYAWIPGMQSKVTATYARAASMAEKVAGESPNAYINSCLGRYYAKLGRVKDSRRRLKAALALAPEESWVHSLAAESYEALGDREQALQQVRRALALGWPIERFRRDPDIKALVADPRFPK